MKRTTARSKSNPSPAQPAGEDASLGERVRAPRAPLLAWYDSAGRDLPWRAAPGETPDPYRVWLSEVMLQQTRVETVRPYYARWLERFPTIQALADAPQDEVLKAWEGLGYYSRARNFHAAVRTVAEQHGGRVPGETQAFRALPGVGRYTAGAVMSIAFGLPEPVVDGNVRRVFARWTDDPAPADDALWRMADALIPGERPGDVNQALMELGATVCTPRNPRCGACPVRAWCAAYAAGTQNERPAPKKAGPLPHEDTAVPVIQRGGEVLLVRRLATARLGGMWAFPQAVRSADEPLPDAAARAARDGLGIEIAVGEAVAVVQHTFTHVKATYHALRCTLTSGDPRPLHYDALAWVPWDRIGDYALPVAQKRIAALAAETTLFTG